MQNTLKNTLILMTDEDGCHGSILRTCFKREHSHIFKRDHSNTTSGNQSLI